MMWLAIFLLGVLWLFWNALQMPRLKRAQHNVPFVSILIPLRNEEQRVPALIDNLRQLDYEKLEVILYDDDSTDATAPLIEKQIDGTQRFTLIKGQPLPTGWKGKPHACMQLATNAHGDIFLFLDADVTLEPNTIDALVATMKHLKTDALSGFPKFVNTSFLEKVLTPLLHFFVYMHLPIQLANTQKFPAASAASGAFLAISKQCYFTIGGHHLVKNTIVEDVTLFREIKKKGFRAYIVHIADFVKCEMYGTSHATWKGFSKNCFEAFGNSYVIGIGVALFYVSYYAMPGVLLFYGSFTAQWLLLIPYFCITFQRLISDAHSRQISMFSLVMPLSAICYSTLLVNAMVKRFRNEKNSWKGREL